MRVEVVENAEGEVEKVGARVGDSRVEGLSFATVAIQTKSAKFIGEINGLTGL